MSFSVDEERLRAAIAAAPDDPEPFLVYADFLQSRGDPAGELIMVMHAREERPDDEALRQRQDELILRSSRALLGGLSKHGQYVDLTWRRGFIQRAALTNREQSPSRSRLARLVALLAEAPAALLVEELVLVAPDLDVMQEAVTAIEAKSTLPLRSLTFVSSAWAFGGESDWGDPWDPVDPFEHPRKWPAPQRPLSLTFRGMVPRRLPSLVADADAITVEGASNDTLAVALGALRECRGAKRRMQLTIIRPTIDGIQSLSTIGFALDTLTLVDVSQDVLEEVATFLRLRRPPLSCAIRPLYIRVANARRLVGDLPIEWIPVEWMME